MYTYAVKQVVKIVDGDTVDVLIDLGFELTKKERVRIAGIDTPEKRTTNELEKRLGKEASNFAEVWFSQPGQIIVKTEKDEKYGRMLGYFYRGEESYSELAIAQGYAWVYDGGNKQKDFQVLLSKRNEALISTYNIAPDSPSG
jgi:micrococcal nuclease